MPQSPNCEVVLSLRTRVFRVAECLADGLDQEFKSLIQGVTTDDNTDLAAILRIYLKKRLASTCGDGRKRHRLLCSAHLYPASRTRA
jgi:hypothetical protein